MGLYSALFGSQEYRPLTYEERYLGLRPAITEGRIRRTDMVNAILDDATTHASLAMEEAALCMEFDPQSAQMLLRVAMGNYALIQAVETAQFQRAQQTLQADFQDIALRAAEAQKALPAATGQLAADPAAQPDQSAPPLPRPAAPRPPRQAKAEFDTDYGPATSPSANGRG